MHCKKQQLSANHLFFFKNGALYRAAVFLHDIHCNKTLNFSFQEQQFFHQDGVKKLLDMEKKVKNILIFFLKSGCKMEQEKVW